MTGHVRDGGFWKLMQNIHIKDGGVWKEVQEAYVKQGGVWKSFHSVSQALSALVSPSNLSENVSNGPNTSASVSASASGGSTPYDYAWTWDSGGTGLTIDTPSAQSTTVSSNGTDEEFNGVLKCTVTDDDSDTASDTCSVTIVHGTPP